MKPFVFGYQFDRESKRLYFRADCIREGRACDLLSVDVTRADATPEKHVGGIHNFHFSDDGQRLLTTTARYQADAYDVAVTNLATKKTQTIDSVIALSPHFLDDRGGRVAYSVVVGERAGVYVSEQVP